MDRITADRGVDRFTQVPSTEALPDGMESRILRSASRVLGERPESQLAALSSEPIPSRIPSTEAGGESESCRIRRWWTLQTRSRREPSDLHRGVARGGSRPVFTQKRDSLGTRPDRRQPRRPQPERPRARRRGAMLEVVEAQADAAGDVADGADAARNGREGFSLHPHSQGPPCRGGTRTRTGSLQADFKSAASTIPPRRRLRGRVT